MKVQPTSEAVRFLNQVREKREDRQQDAQQQNPGHRDGGSEDESARDGGELGPEQVGLAVASFQADEQARANGLSAAVEGKGLGLRVILKDGSGAVVRQFTGEEFVRLREAVSKGAPARGKILDQKL